MVAPSRSLAIPLFRRALSSHLPPRVSVFQLRLPHRLPSAFERDHRACGLLHRRCSKPFLSLFLGYPIFCHFFSPSSFVFFHRPASHPRLIFFIAVLVSTAFQQAKGKIRSSFVFPAVSHAVWDPLFPSRPARRPPLSSSILLLSIFVYSLGAPLSASFVSMPEPHPRQQSRRTLVLFRGCLPSRATVSLPCIPTRLLN